MRPTGLVLLKEVPYVAVVMKSLSAERYWFKGIGTLTVPTSGMVTQGHHLEGVIDKAYWPTPPEGSTLCSCRHEVTVSGKILV